MVISNVQGSSDYFEPVPVVVKKAVLNCLLEGGATLALGLSVACFVPAQIGVGLLVGASLVQIAVSAFFHSLGAIGRAKGWKNLIARCEWMAALNFSFFSGNNPQKIVHELGHALAAMACFKRPGPKIEISPFVGGITQFRKSALSGFGKKIGPAGTTCLIIASGPAFALGLSAIILAIGFAMREKYPQFSKYLIAWGIFDFLDHAYYAYSALHSNPSGLGHDFVHLAIFGLHPVVATVGILAIPILIGVGITIKKGRSCERPTQ